MVICDVIIMSFLLILEQSLITPTLGLWRVIFNLKTPLEEKIVIQKLGKSKPGFINLMYSNVLRNINWDLNWKVMFGQDHIKRVKGDSNEKWIGNQVYSNSEILFYWTKVWLQKSFILKAFSYDFGSLQDIFLHRFYYFYWWQKFTSLLEMEKNDESEKLNFLNMKLPES